MRSTVVATELIKHIVVVVVILILIIVIINLLDSFFFDYIMEIFHGDCLEILAEIEEEIDLVILDLPFQQTDCTWDKKIDIKRLWGELKKICKADCVYVFFCTTKFGNELINSNPKWFRYDLVWHKSTKCGYMNAKYMPLRSHEMIYIFKKNKGCYNAQKTKGKPYIIKGHVHKKDLYNKTKSSPIVNKGDRHPTSILTFKTIHKPLHKTQKPTDIIEWLIRTYSNENDMILDPCMGSGTTGIACNNTNRQFIGIEKDDEIFNIAKKRLQEI